MSVGTITSKGQITIPKDVRDSLGLTPGAKVSFTKNDDGDYVLTTTHRSLMDLEGRLKYAGQPVTLTDMENAISAGAAASI